MRAFRLLATLLFAAAATVAHAGPGEDFSRLLDDAWEWQLRENPVLATQLGERRYDDRWTDLSLDAIDRRRAAQLDFLARLREIDDTRLDEASQLDYRLFRRALQDELDSYPYRSYLMPVNQMGGVQSMESIAEILRLQTVADYEDWLARMAALPVYIEQTRALQEQGRRTGYMPPKVLMERIPPQLDAQLVETAEESPFYHAFETMPDTIPGDDRERLRARARQIIEDDIVPAYRDFDRYFNERYLPACRDTIGASELPNGAAFYEYRVRHFTTTDMTPDEVHRLGLEEVKRIREEMQTIIDELEFDGSFDEFLTFLRTDPRFYHEDPDALFEAYLAMSKRIDPKLVELFGKLPRMPYGLRRIPDNIAPDTTTAYYSRPAADGSRAGYYYVNLYKPETRPTYEIPVLSVHEAVPGHHLQIALQQELGEMPAFRRYSGFTAFIEGWGLYSERLGFEMGLYDDPYDHFGALTYDMWRAVRLVVDTGMHYKGWTRQQAIDFFKANAAKTELDIINEIDRYIAWPGQAVAYKVGQLKMLELREKARRMLGKRFDIRAFHDALLSGGALPLDVLEMRMDRWIAGVLSEETAADSDGERR